jgi:RNA polymerase sigma-70 factor (ECF subfamily)
VASVDEDRLGTLLERARHRDEAALAELLEAHAQRLLASIRGELGERLRQRLESQDVMQQVYMDALRDIDQFVDRGQDSFFAWLRRIALNRICDADRKAFQTVKRGGEVRVSDLAADKSLDPLFDALAGSVSTPSRAAGRSEQARLLWKALAGLSDDQRQVIELRYLSQLNVAETAAKMDRSERAVRSLCVRALIRLRELLDDAI